ncbi:hypothetical protein CGRA01v4_08995 [Colletotrichum graminicola]|nr:hypothetical protein CGRA01v4_08995 [Colletotrichum graminicola]
MLLLSCDAGNRDLERSSKGASPSATGPQRHCRALPENLCCRLAFRVDGRPYRSSSLSLTQVGCGPIGATTRRVSRPIRVAPNILPRRQSIIKSRL